MNKPSGLLFDLDGTLLDTARDLGNALNHVLSLYDLPKCEYHQYREVASHGSNGLLNLGFGDQLKEYDLEVLRKQFLDYYYENICVDTVPFEGINDLVREMDRIGMPWGVVTNKPGWLTDVLMPQFAQFENCKIIISGDTLANRKPHPEPLLFAAKALERAPEEIWYVGDAERDIEAANSAKMTSVLANYGYISQTDKTDEWLADLSISLASELLPYLS